MLLPGTSRIYHGGGPGGGGWPNTDIDGKYLIDRLWCPAQEFTPHPSNPCGGLFTRTLPAGQIATMVYTFATNQTDIMFGWIKPPLYWTYALGGANGFNFKIHFYGDNNEAVNTGVRMAAYAGIFRDQENMNIAAPAMTAWTTNITTQYRLYIYEYNNFTITDPSGAGTSVECLIYFKFERQGLNGADTYPWDIHVMGVSFDFPLVFP